MTKQTEAMKLALEALQRDGWKKAGDAIRALEEALAEQPAQQEPVAWIVEDQSGERLEWAGDAHSCHGVPTFPLYTSTQAQRTWVGLTDEELSEVYNKADWDTVNGWEYERAVEAKLKSKNENRN